MARRLSVFVIYIVFIMILKRSNQLKEKTYNGLLEYLSKETMPTLIVIVGEVATTTKLNSYFVFTRTIKNKEKI